MGVCADLVCGGLVAYDEEGFRSVLPEGETDPLHALRVLSFAKVRPMENDHMNKHMDAVRNAPAVAHGVSRACCDCG